MQLVLMTKYLNTKQTNKKRKGPIHVGLQVLRERRRTQHNGHRQKVRQIDEETDRQTDRVRQTDRDRETERDRE